MHRHSFLSVVKRLWSNDFVKIQGALPRLFHSRGGGQWTANPPRSRLCVYILFYKTAPGFCINLCLQDGRYFPKRFTSRGKFPRVFSQVKTSQPCNLPRGNFPSLSEPHRSATLVCFCRSVWPQLKPAVPQKA